MILILMSPLVLVGGRWQSPLLKLFILDIVRILSFSHLVHAAILCSYEDCKKRFSSLARCYSCRIWDIAPCYICSCRCSKVVYLDLKFFCPSSTLRILETAKNVMLTTFKIQTFEKCVLTIINTLTLYIILHDAYTIWSVPVVLCSFVMSIV